MEKISSFLEKFKNIGIPNEALRNDISEIVLSETGEKIEIKNIAIRDGVAYIKCGPAIKSEIFMKKKKILEAVNKSKTSMPILAIR